MGVAVVTYDARHTTGPRVCHELVRLVAAPYAPHLLRQLEESRCQLTFERAAVRSIEGGAMTSMSGNPQSSAEEEAIRAVIAATTEAFNRHDAQAWIRVCAPGARLVTVRGESMQGVADIEKGLTAIFQGRGRNAALRTLDVAVTFIRPDVALAHVTNEMNGVVTPDGTVQRPHRELSIRVLVRDDNGGWRVAAFHNTIVNTLSDRRAKDVPEQSPGAQAPPR